MNDRMGKDQLEQLARNPHYKMSEAEIAKLDELRTKEYLKNKHKNGVVKHRTNFSKHNPELQEEGQSGTTTSRN